MTRHPCTMPGKKKLTTFFAAFESLIDVRLPGCEKTMMPEFVSDLLEEPRGNLKQCRYRWLIGRFRDFEANIENDFIFMDTNVVCLIEDFAYLIFES